DGTGSIGHNNRLDSNSENPFAIELHAQVVSAMAAEGIYLRELSGGITVGQTPAFNLAINVEQNRFNSTRTPVTPPPHTSAPGGSDLESTHGGDIHLIVADGSLTVTNGGDDDGRGVFLTDTRAADQRQLGNVILETLRSGANRSGDIAIEADVIATDFSGQADTTEAGAEQIVIRTQQAGSADASASGANAGAVTIADGVTISTDDAPSITVTVNGRSFDASGLPAGLQLTGHRVTLVQKGGTSGVIAETFTVTSHIGDTLVLNGTPEGINGTAKLIYDLSDGSERDFNLSSPVARGNSTVSVSGLDSEVFVVGRKITIVDNDSAPESFLITGVSGSQITLDHAVRTISFDPAKDARVLVREGAVAEVIGGGVSGSTTLVINNALGDEFTIGRMIRVATSVETPDIVNSGIRADDQTDVYVVEETFEIIERSVNGTELTLTLSRSLTQDFSVNLSQPSSNALLPVRSGTPAWITADVGDHVQIAAGAVITGGDVQLREDLSTTDTPDKLAGIVDVGSDITVSTDYGVAQHLTQRPTSELLPDAAFLAFPSGNTGLIQTEGAGYAALAGVRIGLFGDENLRLDIDWRDPVNETAARSGNFAESNEIFNDGELITSQRYQLLRLNVGGVDYDLRHAYTTDDFIQLRQLLTDTLFRVDFSVSFHESIDIFGAFIGSEQVSGGRISSTDDVTPRTNGTGEGNGFDPFVVSQAERQLSGTLATPKTEGEASADQLQFETGLFEFVLPSTAPTSFFGRVPTQEPVIPQVFLPDVQQPVFLQVV
ncbi:MAG: hypothetical protein KDA89_16610, partial [Planctomycetaceae bacterium]|nr:hypothetical protein [Planctomycetaceae bacterium]